MSSIEDIFDEILAEATPAEDSVTVCLAGRDVAEWRQLVAELAAAEKAAAAGAVEPSDDRLKTKARPAYVPDAVKTARVAELEAKIKRLTVTLKMRGIGWKAWAKLIAEHPPRKLADGTIDPRDRMYGANVETFFDAVSPLSIYEPKMTPARWSAMSPNLGDGDLDRIHTVAWNLNRSTTNAPFGHAS